MLGIYAGLDVAKKTYNRLRKFNYATLTLTDLQGNGSGYPYDCKQLRKLLISFSGNIPNGHHNSHSHNT